MTCVIGVALVVPADGTKLVYLGADRAGTRSNGEVHDFGPKVFRREGFLIGTSGTYRMTNILQYANFDFQSQPDDVDDMEYLVASFVPRVRSVFAEAGYSKIENNEELIHRALIGYRGELYEMDSDYSILRPKAQVIAIGSGSPYALGALDVLTVGVSAMNGPESVVEKALGVAAHFDNSTGHSFDILCQAWPGGRT